MKSINETFKNWMSGRGHKLFEIKIPINIYNIKKYFIKERKKVYKWKYDSQFCKCDCIANEGGMSDPFCKHMNKLIRVDVHK